MKTRFPSYYGAKFARDKTAKPSAWIISPPDRGGWYTLIKIGEPDA